VAVDMIVYVGGAMIVIICGSVVCLELGLCCCCLVFVGLVYWYFCCLHACRLEHCLAWVRFGWFGLGWRCGSGWFCVLVVVIFGFFCLLERVRPSSSQWFSAFFFSHMGFPFQLV